MGRTKFKNVEAEFFSGKLDFDFSRAGVGHVHRSPSLKEGLEGFMALIVYVTLDLCLFRYIFFSSFL